MPLDAASLQLEELFQTTILAWSQAGELLPIVADPLWQTPDAVEIIPLKGAARVSAKARRFGMGGTQWPELGLHPSIHPSLVCVVTGQADIRTGTLMRGDSPKTKTPQPEMRAHALPAQSCLIIPPGVPYADGTTPHWERPHPENARSQLLWIRIMPTGAVLHTCHTNGLAHAHSLALFVRDSQLWLLTQFLLENALADARNNALLASYLTTLLLCINRNWASSYAINTAKLSKFAVASGRDSTPASEDSHGATLENACRYIGAHLTDVLSPERIAQQCYTSLPQLKRIFRARLDTSIMKYVATQRIEEAKFLLCNTNLTVEQIGEICGYPQRPHFSRVFKAQVGAPPAHFRAAFSSGNSEEMSRQHTF